MIIKGLGLALTTEDMKRVTHAVGAMALAMISRAKDSDDIEEAVAMHVVHGKLIAMLEKAKEMEKASNGDDGDANEKN